MEKDIKVSVCVVTYNQEKYIEQCIKSVLDQETQYSFEIIIGDDASTDGTRDILKKLKSLYPSKIRLILHEKNVGPSDNVFSTYRLAKGEYIAHLDGDDYFFPMKLEQQISLMDKDVNCGISFHSVMKLKSSGEFILDNINCDYMPSSGWIRSDLIQLMALGNNSSKVMRRELFDDFRDPGFPLVDTVFNCLIIGNTTVKAIAGQPLGVYREGVGISSSGDITKKATIQGYEYLIEFLPRCERKYICATSFLLMLLDIKNFRGTAVNYFKLWVKSFDLMFLLTFIKFQFHYKSR